MWVFILIFLREHIAMCTFISSKLHTSVAGSPQQLPSVSAIYVLIACDMAASSVSNGM